jgi:predicted small lipoprotein YifL
VTGRSGRISAARLLVLALALTLALGGCGRKGDLRPPEGEEDAYSGLGVYPAPESVVPQEGEATAVPADEEDPESGPESSPESSEEGAGGP